MSAVLDVHRLQLSTTPTDRLETLVGNTGACLYGQGFQLRATLSDGDEALVRDQRAASDVQTLQRVALGGDLSEPSIGHLRNIPQGEGPERRAAAGERRDARVGDSARRVAPVRRASVASLPLKVLSRASASSVADPAFCQD